MSLSRRTFTKEFKLTALRQLNSGKSLAEVARSLEVNPNVLHRWRRELQHGSDHAFPGAGQRRREEDQIAALERKVGQQTLEIDFLKRVLQKVEEARLLQGMNGSAPFTPRSSDKSTKTPAKRS